MEGLIKDYARVLIQLSEQGEVIKAAKIMAAKERFDREVEKEVAKIKNKRTLRQIICPFKVVRL